jgi:hypothetical protein
VAERRPLVLVNGDLKELPVGDTTPGSGGGLSEAQHEALYTLTHRIARDSFTEVTRSSGRVVSVIVYTTPAKTQKIRETLITYSSGRVSTVTENQYDSGGGLIATYTESISRSGGLVASITGDLT